MVFLSAQASKLVAETVAEVAEAAQKERSLEELSKLPKQKSISEVAVLVGTLVLAVILTVPATNGRRTKGEERKETKEIPFRWKRGYSLPS